MGDDSRKLDVPNNLEDAERFQRLFVMPVVEMVKFEVKSALTALREDFTQDQQEQKALRADVDALKTNQKKALVGWGAFATVLSISTAAAWNWIRDRFKIT